MFPSCQWRTLAYTTRTREQVEVVSPHGCQAAGEPSRATFGEDEFQMFGARYEGCGRVDDRARAGVIGHRIHIANKLYTVCKSCY